MRLNQFVRFGRKIIGITVNYSEQANGPISYPIYYLKPSTSYVTPGGLIRLPKGCDELLHEVELGIVIGRSGFNIPPNQALDLIGGYAICLDMTACELFTTAREKGESWALSKGFDTSCPVGNFIPKDRVNGDVTIWCKVNGAVCQAGSTAAMLKKPHELISSISEYMTLESGDLVLTGSPSTMGTVVSGDKMQIGIEGICEVAFQVTRPRSK